MSNEANADQTCFEVAIELGKWFRSSLGALFSNRHHLAAIPAWRLRLCGSMRRPAEIPPVTWNSRWRNSGSLWEEMLDLQTVFRGDLAGARQTLAKYIEKLVRTPKEIPLGRC